jgi:hypothetical protein
MFANDGIDDEKRGIEEQYATAVGSSNLRVGNDPTIRTSGDMIAAAGMNKHRMGLALRRLMTEWDRSAKAKPLTPAQVEVLARSLPTEPAAVKGPYVGPMPHQPRPNQHAGMVREEVDGKDRYRLPMEIAQEQADAWHAHERGLLFLSMKSLPAIRAALVFQVESREWADPGEGVHVVAAVLQWWLDRTCPTCAGRKLKVIAGTGRTGSKACSTCKGTGESKVPHGWRGRRLVGYISECTTAAARELSEGNFAHHRKPKG